MRLFDVDWPPGWVRGEAGRYVTVQLDGESGRFTAVWYQINSASVYFRRRDGDHLAPIVHVADCPANEVVGQCLLFDTGRYL